jgi:hypothetical protein
LNEDPARAQAPAASSFKSRALPLHVNVTHTPPAIPDKDTENASTADPGFLGSLALVPSTFATGSYGWKGTKRFTVELDDPEGGDGAEKVHVMLTFVSSVGVRNAGADNSPIELTQLLLVAKTPRRTARRRWMRLPKRTRPRLTMSEKPATTMFLDSLYCTGGSSCLYISCNTEQ